jgi:ribonuclease H2 subunit B
VKWTSVPLILLLITAFLPTDGSVYYCTLVDPIFVLLPLFEAARMSVCTYKDIFRGMWFIFRPILLNLKANLLPVLQSGKDLGKFRQLDEILYIEGYPGYQHLMSIAGNHMELVCEVKGRSLQFILVLEIKLY